MAATRTARSEGHQYYLISELNVDRVNCRRVKADMKRWSIDFFNVEHLWPLDPIGLIRV